MSERERSTGVGIRIKLIGTMVAMALVVVCPLAAYFLTSQLEVLRVAAHDRAQVYADLASQQLRSAVAFDDRETAREVLDAIAKDPLLEGLAVFTADGRTLHSQGKLSDVATRAGALGSERTELFTLPGRMLAIAPVRSLEGARGTAVLELSTRSLKLMQQRSMLAAIGIGAGALCFGTLLAWLIARSMVRRIELIADAAAAMSRGELQQVVEVDGPRDELGVLSHGFNTMSRKLRELVTQIQDSARQESERLEQLVSQRTAQLHRKNHDLRLVLDNVEQGFVTIDREARVVGEWSLAIEAWLGGLAPDQRLWDQLATENSNGLLSFQVGWEQVTDGVLPMETALDQMPRRLRLRGRHLDLEYRPLGGDDFERMLVVITDVSASVERELSERESRELANLTARLLQSRTAFLEFFDESQRLLQRILKNEGDAASVKRDLHTLKGNAGIYGLSAISAICHALETELEHDSLESIDRSALAREWERSVAMVERLMGSRSEARIEIDEQQYRALTEAIARDTPKAELTLMLRTWRLESLRERLDRVAEQLTGVATRLGKGQVAVQVTAADIYLGREELSEFWCAFAHVVRNAAVHGMPISAGPKPSTQGPDFDLRAGIERDQLYVELADHGPGIDWAGIKTRATERGMPHATQADLEEALFADGVSTGQSVSDISGRGVGLGAVRAACRKLRGNVRVDTRPGSGTSFRFSWPTAQFKSLIRYDARGAT
jgi:two-component system chemotaxis sensor kinase CheA